MPLQDELIAIADRYWALADGLKQRAEALNNDTARLLRVEGGWDAPKGRYFQATVHAEIRQINALVIELEGLSNDLRRIALSQRIPKVAG